VAMKIKHWQDPMSLILGLWLVISPWGLQYQSEINPMWNAVVVGVLVVAIALYAMFQVMAWQEWLNAALGIWLVVSPWVLGFAGLVPAMWNAVIVGALIAVLAIWALSTDKDIGGWWSPAM
jgi:hypothetical protein